MNASDEIKMKKASNRTTNEPDKPINFKINSPKIIEQRPRSSGFKSFLNWFKKVENLQQENEPPCETDQEESSDEDSSSSSTATVASFAFLPANKYKPYGNAQQPEKYFSPGPYTDTYNRLIMEMNRRRHLDKNITLRKKYSLYSSGTLTSINALKNETIDENGVLEPFNTFSLPTLGKLKAEAVENGERKTASLSSHYKKTHVKGKRRAPQPPNSTDFIRSYRKKRKAPPPPKIEEKPKIELNNVKKTENNDNLTPVLNNKPKEVPDKEINQISLEHSPKLWYKRENKQKNKATNEHKKKSKHEFPEVSFFRCSQLLENIRNMNNKTDSEVKSEKRASRYLPNISELDREAAEIIKQSKTNKIEQTTPWINNPIHNPNSARELITKFNALSTPPEITKNVKNQPLVKRNEIKLTNDLLLKDNKSNEDANIKNIPQEGDISKSFKSEMFSALPNLAPLDKPTDNQNYNKVLDPEEKVKLRELLKEMKDSLPKRPKPMPNAQKDNEVKNNEVKTKEEIKEVNVEAKPPDNIQISKNNLKEIIINNAEKKLAAIELIKAPVKIQPEPIYTNKVSSFAQTNGVLQKTEKVEADEAKPTSSNKSNGENLYMNTEEVKATEVEDKEKKEEIIYVQNNTNVLLKKLEQAIAEGDDTSAAKIAKDLAMLKVNCLVTCSPYNKVEEKHHRIKIYIEDQFSHQGPLPLQIPQNITIGELKQKVEKELNIPIITQRWIIGKQLAADDNAKLSHYNNDDFDTALFLYVIAAEKTNIESPAVKNVEIPVKTTPEVPKIDVKPPIDVKAALPTSSSSPELKNVTKNTWICKECTLINSLLSPLCSACGVKKPQPVKNGEIKPDVKPADPIDHYKQLLNLDNTDLIKNTEDFECPVCFMECKPNDGITLRDCLHTFCRECLQNTIKYSDDAEIKCPYRDRVYFCDSVVQEREIRALVDKTVYEKHLAKSVKFAENKIQNTFHCKTPDCKGWCIYDDNVNHFSCPACKKNNCLTCQAIHEGRNCKQYQEQMNFNNDPTSEGQRTKNMLDDMVKKGEALACPSCEVIMMKKWGCDWVKCSMCKTEICWVTRGPRWGPSGKGDTSAGCQCGVNGIKCHPKCNYCH